QASFYRCLSPSLLRQCRDARHGIALIDNPLIGVIDRQSRRLADFDDLGPGFGLSGFGEKCY
ncbi:MAG: hypothetical protein O3B18_06165, partial [Proteobacteria bacterium]|nr:hypothetical protein [Pseudomonadota bacterium]